MTIPFARPVSAARRGRPRSRPRSGAARWLPAGPPRAQDKDPLVAKVNGVEIRQSDLPMAEEEVGPELPPLSPDAKRDYLVRYLADMILVAKAAEAKKIGDSASSSAASPSSATSC